MSDVRGRGRYSAVPQMREAWELWDMTLSTGGAAAASGNGQVNPSANDGSLRLVRRQGSVIAASGPCQHSEIYLLFGLRRSACMAGKLSGTFRVDATERRVQRLGGTTRFRVGRTAQGGWHDVHDTNTPPGRGGKQGALNLNGTNQGAAVCKGVPVGHHGSSCSRRRW